MSISSIIVGFLSGIIASMGMGGGAVLLIYLVVFTSAEQLAAQGINLAVFIPIGILSVIIYAKQKKIQFAKTLPVAAFGVLGAFLGIEITKYIHSDWLRIIFAVFIIFLGVKEFFSKGCKEGK